MNKTFNINLGGFPFSIDEDAFNYIQHYLETIRQHFSTSEGCDEILYDIEVRMAELFQEHLKGRAIISMKEIDEVILIMGKPEDFGAEPMDESHQNSYKSKKAESTIKTGKRLFRDPDDKKLGGVCSGIAAYFGVEDPLWVRLIFALLFISGGIGVIPYIILWALIPEATSAGDKLSMRGEPATIHNIAKMVEGELNELGDKINEWSKDLGSKKKSDDINARFYAKSILTDGINIFGKIAANIIPILRDVIKPVLVVIGVIIMTLLGISWAASFIGLTFAAPSLMAMGPDSSAVGYLGLVSIFFALGIPLLGMMLMVARLAFGYRLQKNVRTGLWTVWFLSLFTFSFAGISTAKDYSIREEQSITTDYTMGAAEIKISMPETDVERSFGTIINEFFNEKGDQWEIRDVRVKVEKSSDALVHINKKLSARGSDSNEAIQNASFALNTLSVTNSEINISKFISIPGDKKFRNQSIEYTIYIPEGKKVNIDNSIKGCMRESALFPWDKIHANIDNLLWTVTHQGLISDAWSEIYEYKKEVTPGNYSRIIIENSFNVFITKGDKPIITFEGDKDMINKIITKNLDGTLSLNTESDDDAYNITIRIQTPSIEFIHLAGVKSAEIDGFNQDKLKLICIAKENDHDDSKIRFFGNIKNMDVSLDGDLALFMTGSGDNLDLQVNHGATIESEKYLIKSVSWKGDTGASSRMYVSDKFLCDDPSANEVTLIGNAKKVKNL
jgi:phage shock protein PspC (stress-responsive transcriptional regulator)